MNRININGRAATPSWDRVAGRWQQLTGSVQERWGQLTEDDIARIGGRREQLIGKIQERYGIIQDQAERQIADWLNEISEKYPA